MCYHLYLSEDFYFLSTLQNPLTCGSFHPSSYRREGRKPSLCEHNQPYTASKDVCAYKCILYGMWAKFLKQTRWLTGKVGLILTHLLIKTFFSSHPCNFVSFSFFSQAKWWYDRKHCDFKWDIRTQKRGGWKRDPVIWSTPLRILLTLCADVACGWHLGCKPIISKLAIFAKKPLSFLLRNVWLFLREISIEFLVGARGSGLPAGDVLTLLPTAFTWLFSLSPAWKDFWFYYDAAGGLSAQDTFIAWKQRWLTLRPDYKMNWKASIFGYGTTQPERSSFPFPSAALCRHKQRWLFETSLAHAPLPITHCTHRPGARSWEHKLTSHLHGQCCRVFWSDTHGVPLLSIFMSMIIDTKQWKDASSSQMLEYRSNNISDANYLRLWEEIKINKNKLSVMFTLDVCIPFTVSDFRTVLAIA